MSHTREMKIRLTDEAYARLADVCRQLDQRPAVLARTFIEASLREAEKKQGLSFNTEINRKAG